ncbi:CHAT domain-containing protein [Kitasatospora sp. LaBMicrA B282]|uniref:CHAT domain-containing tetratricopeptide repeat protein n=1 Tax=Kitasatospora sp. LaBMicrA B282 TaxID=3420949 RepID=UPI003D0B485A
MSYPDRHVLDPDIERYRAALAEPSADEGARVSAAANLRTCLYRRWSALHRVPDRDELILLGDRFPGPDRLREQDLLFRGEALADRYLNERREEDFAAAVSALGEAAELPPARCKNRPAVLNALGALLLTRCRQSGDPRDLAAAERILRRSLGRLPSADPCRPAVLGNLATVRLRAFEVHGEAADLQEAVELLRTALAFSPAGAELRPVLLQNLGHLLRVRIEQQPDPAAIQELLRVARTALAEAPDDPPDDPARLVALAGLGVALRIAAEYTDGAALLPESVELLREAVRYSTPGGPFQHTTLNSLGNALLRSAQQTGDAELLDEGIDALRQSLAQAPPDEQDDPAMANLAGALRERYQQTGDLAALREAVDLARQVRRSPLPPGLSAANLANLGVILQSWHQRTGDRTAAEEAVEVAREVLAGTPADPAGRGEQLNQLGNALHARFEASGDLADLDEAVDLGAQAVAHTAYGDARHARFLQALGGTLLAKAEATGDRAVLEQAVTTLGRAAWAPCHTEEVHADHLRSYARALRTLYAAGRDPAVLRAAEDAFWQSASIPAQPASRRIGAAFDGGAAAAHGGRWEQALRGYRLAIELLPFGVTRRLARSDQEYRLATVHGLAADAAACAVNAGRPEEAVRLLEQGRGVLLGQALAARGAWEPLRAAHPELAERFLELRDRIDALAAEDAQHGGAGAVVDERHALAVAWEQLLTRIRELPGFADFLAVPLLADLLATADRGPVVLAYCSAYRSDALVLTPGGVRTVPLPQATPAAVAHQVARLDRALAAATDPAGEQRAQQDIAEVLAWTWDCVTAPVLDALGLLGAPPGDAWPRLWWSPGGALAALPLHAAGRHGGAADGSRQSVLDRVISSYTPTVRALAYARDRAARPRPAGRLLAVALPDTPGAAPLGGVRREVRELRRLLPTDVLSGAEATLGGVLRVLPGYSYVHFACHGVGDPDDPSNARLLVHDHRDRPLTVRRLSRLDLPEARLAVLSACETARGPERLADESIHITSAFQIAGYPHAIGTLWPVHDVVAVRVAREFYRFLRAGRPADAPGLDADRSAAALHHAVRQCRADFGRSPSLWAAHVHSGA